MTFSHKIMEFFHFFDKKSGDFVAMLVNSSNKATKLVVSLIYYLSFSFPELRDIWVDSAFILHDPDLILDVMQKKIRTGGVQELEFLSKLVGEFCKTNLELENHQIARMVNLIEHSVSSLLHMNFFLVFLNFVVHID